MDSQILYFSGEEVKPGDRVQLAGTYATVVFVSNGETYEFSPGYEDYAGSDRGVVICDDDGGVSSVGELGTELIFLDRG